MWRGSEEGLRRTPTTCTGTPDGCVRLNGMPATTSKERLLARLDRAGSNLTELNELFHTFMSDKRTYRIRSLQDLYTNDIVCYVQLLREPAFLAWASIIGDVVHNLRATLDNLVWELSVAFSGAPPDDPIPAGSRWRRICFPIITDSVKWEPSLSHGGLWAVDPSLLPTFLKYQPFVTGKGTADREPLAILHDLWNIDKHRHIHVVIVGVAPNSGHTFAFPTRGRGTVKNVGGLRTLELNKLTELFEVEVAEQVPQHVEMNWAVGFELSFSEGPPAYRRDTFDFLSGVKDTITTIVDEFESALT